jgi:hypothetical protein
LDEPHPEAKANDDGGAQDDYHGENDDLPALHKISADVAIVTAVARSCKRLKLSAKIKIA